MFPESRVLKISSKFKGEHPYWNLIAINCFAISVGIEVKGAKCEIVFYTLFVFGHYFVQYGLVQVCIFYWFLWKTTFLSVCAFHIALNFGVTFE